MKKILTAALCAVCLVLALAGCGEPSTVNLPPLPSETAGVAMSTFTGTITAKKGNVLTLDMLSDSMSSWTAGQPTPPRPSPPNTALPVSARPGSYISAAPSIAPSIAPSAAATSPAQASPTPSKAVSPSPSAISVTKGINVVVPYNAAVIHPDGKPGKYSDLKTGKTAVFTMIDSVVTAVSLTNSK